MPATTVYIGPYVAGPRDGRPRLASPKECTWSIIWKVLRQSVAGLHPQALRRKSTPRFILEMVALCGLGIIVMIILIGVDRTIWSGLFMAEVILALAIFLAEFSSVWKWQRREERIRLNADASQPLAYRFVHYRAPFLNANQCENSLFEELQQLIGHAQFEAVSTHNLSTGDVVLIEPGQRIPADGAVLEGAALVDEAIVTGQSNPVIRESGRASWVMRDTTIIDGRLVVEVAPQRGHPLDWHQANLAKQVASSQAPLTQTTIRNEPLCF